MAPTYCICHVALCRVLLGPRDMKKARPDGSGEAAGSFLENCVECLVSYFYNIKRKHDQMNNIL